MRFAIQILILFAVLFAIGTAIFLPSLLNKMLPKATSFSECAQHGYPVSLSYPRTCRTPQGKVFTEKVSGGEVPPSIGVSDVPTQVVGEKNILVDFPKPQSVVSNPLIIIGQARVFENVVNYRVEDLDGKVLAVGSMTAQSPDVGRFGAFQKSVTIAPDPGTSGILTVFSFSPKDGSEINVVKIQIQF